MSLWGALCEAYRRLGGRAERVRASRKRRPTRPSVRLGVEVLPDRIAPAVDIWVAPAGATNWDADTNWSLMRKPAAGDDVVFQAPVGQGSGQGSTTPCVIPAGDTIPTLNSLTLDSGWGGKLTLNSDLPANQVTFNAKTLTGGSNQFVINAGSHLYALQGLTWNGGSVVGSGALELASISQINGTVAADSPTLGCLLDIGTTFAGQPYASGTLNFAQNTQPLVVQGNAKISINSGSTLAFQETAAPNMTVTAVSNGDGNPHSILVNGGSLTRTNFCQLVVGMGLDVESGTVTVGNPAGQFAGSPLHFTSTNPDGSGLETNGGQVNVNADLTSDAYGNFLGGSVTVAQGATFTLGVDVRSTASNLDGATLIVQGNFVPHGGFTMEAGILGTGGFTTGQIKLDAGTTFQMLGGEMDVSDVADGAAQGQLLISGNFTGAQGAVIVINVDESQNNPIAAKGVLTISGLLNGNGVTIRSDDLNPVGVNPVAWRGLVKAGAFVPKGGVPGIPPAFPQPDVTYDMPETWTQDWTAQPAPAVGFELDVTEQ